MPLKSNLEDTWSASFGGPSVPDEVPKDFRLHYDREKLLESAHAAVTPEQREISRVLEICRDVAEVLDTKPEVRTVTTGWPATVRNTGSRQSRRRKKRRL